MDNIEKVKVVAMDHDRLVWQFLKTGKSSYKGVSIKFFSPIAHGWEIFFMETFHSTILKPFFVGVFS